MTDQLLVEELPHRDGEGVSFRTDCDDALVFLTPVLGPTGTLLLHRLARAIHTGGPRCWSVDDLAATFGVSPAVLDRTIDRLEWFGYARRDGYRLQVRTVAPRLHARWIDRLPGYLAGAADSLSDRGAA